MESSNTDGKVCGFDKIKNVQILLNYNRADALRKTNSCKRGTRFSWILLVIGDSSE